MCLAKLYMVMATSQWAVCTIMDSLLTQAFFIASSEQPSEALNRSFCMGADRVDPSPPHIMPPTFEVC